ncbi:SGNH/GDSL hydrolase family protein [Catenuloplanes atrovinosus]|uniref:Lysophospholipase L1-like esterase n=1 Tax=Catenuloplanes atrovinosus TaxID=137266 RepID=A0AAE3YLM1_9ACTN|nr:SGNH/GDSL hydrolase family protein [Catenuloplanes atrovinosus]MDR7274772.1 lysophospholipase L1-like esterase [Catenuloplanes atrovinosus]
MRFVAIGDSFTEGVGDELPDGTVRGWADLVAAGLAAASGEPVQYANLAVRGRLLESIIGEQLPAALDMSPPPTLISLNGGGNDMLRRGMKVDHLVRLTERAVRRCADAGVGLLLISGPDPSGRLPFGRTIHRRGAELTVAVAELAARHGLPFANSFDDVEIRRPQYWAADRLHLNAAGHRRVAGIVLAALGHAAGEHRLDPAPAPARRLLAEARYYREHVVPFVQRRLQGRSSGDGRAAKHPSWVRVLAA